MATAPSSLKLTEGWWLRETSGTSRIFSCAKTTNSPRITEISRAYKFKMGLLNLLDPCKSVLSALSSVRFRVLCKTRVDLGQQKGGTPVLRVPPLALRKS